MDGTKRDSVVFASKIQLLSKNVCNKVSAYGNVNGKVIATSFFCILWIQKMVLAQRNKKCTWMLSGVHLQTRLTFSHT